MRKFLPFLALFTLFPILVLAQSPDHKVIKRLWHESLLREVQGKYSEAVDSLNHLIGKAEVISHPVSEWYIGTSYFVKARCYARLGMCDSVRASVEQAFTHQFRNNGLFRFDTTILSVCGRSWFDSLEHVWMNIQEKEMSQWEAQPPVIILPNNWETKGKLNLIIVLHGGNGSYVRFADFWSSLADTLHAMIVVPAGTVRLSNITNSWSTDDHQNEAMISNLLSQIIEADIIDTNNIYLAGYSQGAELALKLTSCSNLPIKGVIAFSGFYNSTPCTNPRDITRSSTPSIFALSGVMEDNSNLVSIKRAKEEFGSEHIPFKLELADGMLHEIPVDFSYRVFQAWNWLHSSH
jgi:predicted esterase